MRLRVTIAILLGMCLATAGAAWERHVVSVPDVVWYGRMEILQAQIGVRERTGHNDGAEIDRYLISVGAPLRSPWCYAVQYYCTLEAARMSGYTTAGIPRTASTQAAWFQTAIHKAVNTWPQVGDIVIWYVPRTYTGHCATITKVDGIWIITREGNTSNGRQGSQREGNGFYERRRCWIHPLANMFLRGFIGNKS